MSDIKDKSEQKHSPLPYELLNARAKEYGFKDFTTLYHEGGVYHVHQVCMYAAEDHLKSQLSSLQVFPRGPITELEKHLSTVLVEVQKERDSLKQRVEQLQEEVAAKNKEMEGLIEIHHEQSKDLEETCKSQQQRIEQLEGALSAVNKWAVLSELDGNKAYPKQLVVSALNPKQ